MKSAKDVIADIPQLELIPVERTPAGLAPEIDEVILPEDVGYTHPVFLQCFLPTSHSAANKDQWQTDNGRASLLVRAGVLVDPNKQNVFKRCVVPAGPKARIINAYVNDFIFRYRTSTVNLGRSLRKTMERLDIAVGGANGKLLTREMENFAAAEIILGTWDDGKADMERATVAKSMSFWIEKNPEQGTIWQPEMIVSAEYYEAVLRDDRMAPFYWPALVALQHDTRAMDIHCYLTYRLKNGLKRPLTLHSKVLHPLFGQDIKGLKQFWHKFKKSLAAAQLFYPQAQIEVKNDCIVLRDSPALIPYRKVNRIGTSTGV
jgi:hypothetical protein